MAKEFVLDAEMRDVVGKKVKRLRKNGIVPAVIYGPNDPINIQLDSLKTRLTLRDADDNSLLTINLNGDEHEVIVREIQRHVIRGDLIHIDFLEVERGQKLTTEASLIMDGVAAPESQSLGQVTQVLFSISIEAAPRDLVSELKVDATLIADTDSVIVVSDITPPKGVSIMSDPDLLVAKFDLKREEVAPGAEESAEEVA